MLPQQSERRRPLWRRSLNLLSVVLLLTLVFYAFSAFQAHTLFWPGQLFQSQRSALASQHAAPSGPLFPSGPDRVAVTHDIAYGPLQEELLDLCQPVGVPGLHPGIILIHSSGFDGSDKEDGDTQPTCNNFASQGFVVANVDYRLAPKHIWPAPLVDVQLAVRWLRSQANSLALDPQRLCATGPSFGGYLAVFLGVLQQTHAGDEADLYPDQSSAVSCVSDFFGPVDFMPPSDAVTSDLTHTSLGVLGGATSQSDPDLYRDASPIYHVSPQSAPMIIVQGTRDSIVSPEQSLALLAALQQNHVFVDYLSYDGDHELTGLNNAQIDAIWAQVLAFHTLYQHP